MSLGNHAASPVRDVFQEARGGWDGSALGSREEEMGQVLAVGRGIPPSWERGGSSNALRDPWDHRAAQKARKTYWAHPVLAVGLELEGSRERKGMSGGAPLAQVLPGMVTLPHHSAKKHPTENTNGLKINTSALRQESRNFGDVGGCCKY